MYLLNECIIENDYNGFKELLSTDLLYNSSHYADERKIFDSSINWIFWFECMSLYKDESIFSVFLNVVKSDELVSLLASIRERHFDYSQLSFSDPVKVSVFKLALNLDLNEKDIEIIENEIKNESRLSYQIVLICAAFNKLNFIKKMSESSSSLIHLERIKDDIILASISQSSFDVIDYIVNKLGLSKNKQTMNQIFCASVMFNKSDLMKIMLHQYPDVIDLNFNDNKAIKKAIKCNAIDCIKVFEHIWPDLFFKYIKNGYAIGRACKYGYFELVKYLIINYEMQLSLEDFIDDYLSEACASGNTQLVEYLISNKSGDLNSEILSGKLLSNAVNNNKIEVVKYLFEKVRIPVSDEYFKALNLCVIRGYFEIFKYLINIYTPDLYLFSERKFEYFSESYDTSIFRFCAILSKYDYLNALMCLPTFYAYAYQNFDKILKDTFHYENIIITEMVVHWGILNGFADKVQSNMTGTDFVIDLRNFSDVIIFPEEVIAILENLSLQYRARIHSSNALAVVLQQIRSDLLAKEVLSQLEDDDISQIEWFLHDIEYFTNESTLAGIVPQLSLNGYQCLALVYLWISDRTMYDTEMQLCEAKASLSKCLAKIEEGSLLLCLDLELSYHSSKKLSSILYELAKECLNAFSLPNIHLPNISNVKDWVKSSTPLIYANLLKDKMMTSLDTNSGKIPTQILNEFESLGLSLYWDEFKHSLLIRLFNRYGYFFNADYRSNLIEIYFDIASSTDVREIAKYVDCSRMIAQYVQAEYLVNFLANETILNDLRQKGVLVVWDDLLKVIKPQLYDKYKDLFPEGPDSSSFSNFINSYKDCSFEQVCDELRLYGVVFTRSYSPLFSASTMICSNQINSSETKIAQIDNQDKRPLMCSDVNTRVLIEMSELDLRYSQ